VHGLNFEAHHRPRVIVIAKDSAVFVPCRVIRRIHEMEAPLGAEFGEMSAMNLSKLMLFCKL
jgi:hypothetical protein